MKYTPKNIAFNGVLYMTFIYTVIYFLKKEVQDLFGPTLDTDDPFESTPPFGDGCGKYIHPFKPHKNMTNTEIYENISNLASSNENLPKWRRSVVLAIFISVFLIIIFHKKMVSFSRFLTYFLVCFVFINFSFSYYHYHYEKHAIDHIKGNVEILKSRDPKGNKEEKELENKGKNNEHPREKRKQKKDPFTKYRGFLDTI